MNVDRPVDYKRIGSRSIDVVFIETDQIILDLDILLVEAEGRTAVTYTAELSIRTYPLTAGAEVVPVIASSPCKAPVSLAMLSGMNGFTISNGKAVIFIFPSR